MTDLDIEVPRFNPSTFGSEVRFARIGTGSVGSKAVGLQQIHRDILPRFDETGLDGVIVSVPPAVVLATDIFTEFVTRNRLMDVVLSGLPYSRIALEFQRGELTEEVRSELRTLLGFFKAPIAVRPSSFLEDTHKQDVAGIYSSQLIPNSEVNDDTRYRRLSAAVKRAWATIFSENAVVSRRSSGLADDAEKMAVIIQEISGARHDGRYYPTVSGLARSYNHYPVPGNKREDGVVTVALGLGKIITDGDHVWSYCPSRATAPPPFKNIRELLKFTQNSFWAVNVDDPPVPESARETSCLVKCGLADAESDGTLDLLASTWDPDSDQLRSGLSGSGPRAVTFAPLLESRSIPFTPTIERLVELTCNALNGEAEIEFTADFDDGGGLPMKISFVQVRQMLTPGERTVIEESDLEGEDVLVSSDNCLGQGSRDDLSDVVYLRPEHFDRGSTRMMATELDAVNRGLVEEGRHGVFIGPGRWGTTDDRFGVPVAWGQISAARVIVEATMPDAPSSLSHGTHFFHRLLSNRVLYMSVEADGRGRIDWDFLDSREAVWESRYVRHVRLDAPLEVRIDCANRRGLIRRTSAD